jgi:CRP/FNR family transcriptional regulator, cyclic AMP receptor protein
MKETKVDAGAVIYREGGPGDAVYILTNGEVEVMRQVDGKQVHLAVLRSGAIFGEMGVIRNKPRSTTIRAVDNVTLMTIPAETFLSIFRRDNPLALPLFQMLCERLLQAENRLLEQHIYVEGARVDKIEVIRVLAASPEIETQIGSEGVTVDKLPFHVGRTELPGESASDKSTEMMLRALSGQMSPLQFAIEDREGRLIVRDLGSHLGTLVNGRRIAHFERTDVADLRFGENRIQAGGLESPYRFHVIVERVAETDDSQET